MHTAPITSFFEQSTGSLMLFASLLRPRGGLFPYYTGCARKKSSLVHAPRPARIHWEKNGGEDKPYDEHTADDRAPACAARGGGHAGTCTAPRGADGEWAGAMTPDTFAAAGDGGACSATARPCCAPRWPTPTAAWLQIRAMCGAQRTLGLPPAGRWRYLLPPAAAGGAERGAARFLDAVAARANAPLVAALPSRPAGRCWPRTSRRAFYLWAMRPLASLRPHYIFLRGGVQTGRQCRIIRETDTLALSRALAIRISIVVRAGAAVRLPCAEGMKPPAGRKRKDEKT